MAEWSRVLVRQSSLVKMQLIVRGNATYAVEAVNFEDLRAQVIEREGSEDVLFYLAGQPLTVDDHESLVPNATIDINIPLKGGKVHGSLARAGKVRGQTPKVEAQEKKKKKTGRAKRRIQYNRRFVNVVATFGRKRGPNSNS
eukprot:TCALIF_09825-PA protein Name:"Similar to Fau 40S ribosomal protein S30 (Rattus norvegicus)" AED:0.07 eAED:0.07 QI:0/0.5/0.66/0.66/1/1/3/61/141